MAVDGILREFKTEMALALMCKRLFKVDEEKGPLPSIFGLTVMFGEPWVFIQSQKFLQDLYINKNATITKDPGSTRMFAGVMDRSIFFGHTHDKSYIEKRKELSGAFFKARLIAMTKIIKHVAMDEIRLLQAKPQAELDNFNITDFVLGLQGRLIISITVGLSYAKRTCPWEKADGTIEDVEL